MTEKILVPLKRDDNIEDIIPYVEKVAQPGMRLVFLVHCPVDGFEYIFDHVATMETGLQKTSAAVRVAKTYSLLEERAIGLFGMFKRPSFSPVLLLHPDQGVAHS
jgi:hypothetical protein